MHYKVLIFLFSCFITLQGCSMKNDANPLQERAKKFLQMPIPEGMNYVPDSIAEIIIVQYAQTGKAEFDPELVEAMGIMMPELQIVENATPNSEDEFMNESTYLIHEIYKEVQKNKSR